MLITGGLSVERIDVVQPAQEVRQERGMKNGVRTLRLERGWTQADLAQRLKVSRNSVNAIETGRYEPSLSLALRVARLFAKKVEDIFQDAG